MKKYSLLFLLIVFQCSVFQSILAQSADKGRVNVYLGGGVNMMNRQGNGNINLSKDFISTKSIIGLDYNVEKQISFGIEVIEDAIDVEHALNLINVRNTLVGINIKYHFLNKKRSSAYIGTSLGGFSFEYQLKDSVLNQGQFLGNGIYNTMFIGYNKYFGKVFGLFVQTGFINQPMQMNTLTFNGTPYDRWNRLLITDWNVIMRGVFVNAGITLKFRNK